MTVYLTDPREKTVGIKIIAKNKRASYDYFLEEKFEAGLVLVGTEVKSLRLGKVSLAEAHIAMDRDGEMWIHNMTIPQFEFGNIHNHQENRKRKLLLHRKEIHKVYHNQKTKSLTLIPTMIYFKNSRIKLEFALARGKKKYDKRQVEAKRDAEKKIRKANYDD